MTTKKTNCLHCGEKLTTLVRITSSEDINGKITERENKTEIEICENPKCWSYIDLKKIRNWKAI